MEQFRDYEDVYSAAKKGHALHQKTDHESCPVEKPILFRFHICVQQKDTSSALEPPQKTETGSLLGDKKHPNGSNKGMHFYRISRKPFKQE